MPEGEQVLSISPEQLAALRVIVHSDTPDGFDLFFSLLFNRPLPAHGREWIEKIYEARKLELGVVIRGFRGSTKTTIISNGFVTYQIGLHPDRANVIIQASDPKAKDNAQMVAVTIETNAVFRAFFPNVVPDKDIAWGEDGYSVKRNDMDYGEWRRGCGKDPTIVGYGITSSTLIGGHPDGVLDMDDIHDEENTRSNRERDHVLRKLTGTVLPMAIPGKTFKLGVGTPWLEGDALDYLEQTGEYAVINTPMYTEVDATTPGAEWLDELGGTAENKWVRPTWNTERPLKVIKSLRREWGPVDFPRMAQLDLTKVKAGVLSYQSFRAEDIRPNWPMVGGVDYAGTINPKAGSNLDFFAHCYGAKPPQGGLVIVGGEHERTSQARAEKLTRKPQDAYPNWSHTVIEGDGKGEEFFQVLTRNPGLRVTTEKTGGKSKHERFLRQLQPHLEVGTIRISDADTPFLNRLRWELENWPNVDHDDTLDALYWCARAAKDVLAASSADDLPAVRQTPRLRVFSGIAAQTA